MVVVEVFMIDKYSSAVCQEYFVTSMPLRPLKFIANGRSEAWNSVCKHPVPSLDENPVIRRHLRPYSKELVDALVEDALPEAHS